MDRHHHSQKPPEESHLHHHYPRSSAPEAIPQKQRHCHSNGLSMNVLCRHSKWLVLSPSSLAAAAAAAVAASPASFSSCGRRWRYHTRCRRPRHPIVCIPTHASSPPQELLESVRPEALLEVLQGALSLRQVEVTERNPVSSRSHAVCELRVLRRGGGESAGAAAGGGVLRFVDLAGSERNYETHAMTAQQHRDSADINTALMALKVGDGPHEYSYGGTAGLEEFHPDTRKGLCQALGFEGAEDGRGPHEETSRCFDVPPPPILLPFPFFLYGTGTHLPHCCPPPSSELLQGLWDKREALLPRKPAHSGIETDLRTAHASPPPPPSPLALPLNPLVIAPDPSMLPLFVSHAAGCPPVTIYLIYPSPSRQQHLIVLLPSLRIASWPLLLQHASTPLLTHRRP